MGRSKGRNDYYHDFMALMNELLKASAEDAATAFAESLEDRR
jgi:hypothetical protein